MKYVKIEINDSITLSEVEVNFDPSGDTVTCYHSDQVHYMTNSNLTEAIRSKSDIEVVVLKYASAFLPNKGSLLHHRQLLYNHECVLALPNCVNRVMEDIISIAKSYLKSGKRDWSFPSALRSTWYKHYKGGIYRVLAHASREEDLEQMVVYQGLDGKNWVRTLKNFEELVDGVPRFSKIGE